MGHVCFETLGAPLLNGQRWRGGRGVRNAQHIGVGDDGRGGSAMGGCRRGAILNRAVGRASGCGAERRLQVGVVDPASDAIRVGNQGHLPTKRAKSGRTCA